MLLATLGYPSKICCRVFQSCVYSASSWVSCLPFTKVYESHKPKLQPYK